MTTYRTVGWIGAIVVLIGGWSIGSGTNGCLFAQGPPPPIPSQEQVEVLTRGPVHEAFAEPVPLEAQAGLVVTRQPPANIEEIPPAERPQGDNFVWVPGYWGWDADRNDFIWVTACWRAAPPRMYWVPGYWAEVLDDQPAERGGVNVSVGGLVIHVGGGQAAPVTVPTWEWVPGFWAPVGAQEIEYLPAPPAPMDVEPPGPAPHADSSWVPGCWYWRQDQYVRRPGYWMRQQPNWVWVPSHYRWTPRGYVFEAGHWDYSLDRRGVLFAPVYIPRSVYSRRGFAYSPTIAIDLGVLSAHLFAYPRYSHYYFGDYYDDAYLRAGIYPQFESRRRHTWYDPIYTYDRWHYGRADKQWDEHQRQQYDRRRSDKTLRPAHTYREMETRTARMPEAQRRNVELARPLPTIVDRKSSPLRYERINTDSRQKISRQAADTNKLRDERARWEARRRSNPAPAQRPARTTVTPPAEHRRENTPPAVRRDTAPPPAERERVRTPQTDRRGTTTPPTEPAPVPPRQIHLTKPERVRIPIPPPTVGKPVKSPGVVDKGPPARPSDEQRLKTDDAKTPSKADAKDKRNNKGNRKDR